MDTLYTFWIILPTIKLKVYTLGGLMNSATKIKKGSGFTGLFFFGGGVRLEGSGGSRAQSCGVWV